MPSLAGVLRGLYDEVDAEALDARHRCDGCALAFAFDHEHRPDEIVRRQTVLGNEIA